MTDALVIKHLESGYGELKVVRGIDLVCRAGEVTAILGRNGAGKTTMLSAISGLLPSIGTVAIFGEGQDGDPASRVRAGLSLVQEGKRVFRSRTVEENLRIGGFVHRRRKGYLDTGITRAFEKFPILKQKRTQPAGLLSGGQQQMLAIAQALMAEPKILMLDEPSAGLAPSIVDEVFAEILQLKHDGLCVLLVEQQVDNSLRISDRVMVLDNGRISLDQPVRALTDWDVLRDSYLGTRTSPGKGTE